jgi:hypothetical protein
LIYDFRADGTVELFAQLHFFRPKQPRPLYTISKVVRNRDASPIQAARIHPLPA